MKAILFIYSFLSFASLASAAGPAIEGDYVCATQVDIKITKTGDEYFLISRNSILPLDNSLTGASARNAIPCSNAKKVKNEGGQELLVTTICDSSRVGFTLRGSAKETVINFQLGVSIVTADVIRLDASTSTFEKQKLVSQDPPISVLCVRKQILK